MTDHTTNNNQQEEQNMGFTLIFRPDFEPISEGVHAAVCDKIIDLGDQVGSEQYGSKINHQVYIGWQIADDGDSVKYIGRIYNVSKDKKSSLRKDLEAWRGKEFQEGEEFCSDNLLGKGCLLQVTHVTTGDGKVRDRVKGIMSLPKGTVVQQPAEFVNFDLTPDTWQNLDPRIPNWITEIIKKGITYNQFSNPPQPVTAEDVFGPAPEEDTTLDDLPWDK